MYTDNEGGAVNATARIDLDGTAHVFVDGQSIRLAGESPADARALLIDYLADRLDPDGEDIVDVDVDDAEEGRSRVAVHPDRFVELLDTPPNPEPEPEAEREQRPAEPKRRPARSRGDRPEATADRTETSASSRAAERAVLLGHAAEAFTSTQRPPAIWPAERGWRGAVNRLSAHAIKLAPGATEKRRRAARVAIQRGLASHKTVTFVNIKGGVGKSTNTFLVGATYGRERGGSVLAWDSNPDKGTLGDRSMTSGHDHTAIDLLNQVSYFTERNRGEEELVNFVRSQGPNHFDVLASQNQASTAVPIDGEGFNQLQDALQRFYRLILVDTGNASNTDTWQAAVRSADVLVICTLNKEDSAKTAAATLDTLAAQGYSDKIGNAVVLITETQRSTKDSQERLTRMRETFGGLVRATVSVPFDPHLDEGGRIEWNNLKPETREAFLYVNAAITDGL